MISALYKIKIIIIIINKNDTFELAPLPQNRRTVGVDGFMPGKVIQMVKKGTRFDM